MTPTARMKKAGHLRQQVPAVDHPKEEKIMTIVQPAPIAVTSETHYPWCDPALCVALDDYDGVGEPGVLHSTETAVFEHDAGKVTARGVRFCTSWSETEGAITVLFQGLDAIPLQETIPFGSAGIGGWITDVGRWVNRVMTPSPTTPCPTWCTAETSTDVWVAASHTWDLSGGKWARRHLGPSRSGTRFQCQYEFSEPDGTTRLTRIVPAQAPREEIGVIK